jgi:hypothetical protein
MVQRNFFSNPTIRSVLQALLFKGLPCAEGGQDGESKMIVELNAERLKRLVFSKWKKFCIQNNERNIDWQGNEYYLHNGIFCIHITDEKSKYRYGSDATSRYQGERNHFEPGYYILSTRTPNYTIIDDPDVLHFILHFDLRAKKSLHKELKRRMGVEFTGYESLTK